MAAGERVEELPAEDVAEAAGGGRGEVGEAGHGTRYRANSKDDRVPSFDSTTANSWTPPPRPWDTVRRPRLGADPGRGSEVQRMVTRASGVVIFFAVAAGCGGGGGGGTGGGGGGGGTGGTSGHVCVPGVSVPCAGTTGTGGSVGTARTIGTGGTTGAAGSVVTGGTSGAAGTSGGAGASSGSGGVSSGGRGGAGNSGSAGASSSGTAGAATTGTGGTAGTGGTTGAAGAGGVCQAADFVQHRDPDRLPGGRPVRPACSTASARARPSAPTRQIRHGPSSRTLSSRDCAAGRAGAFRIHDHLWRRSDR